MACKFHLLACALALVQFGALPVPSESSQEYEVGKQSRIKLNLGLHVPPIVLKLPRLELPQLTIGANLIKRPNAKPLLISLPPPPSIQFGDSGAGNYGGSATYTQTGGGGGGGAGGGGFEGDQFSSGTHQKAVKMENKKLDGEVSKQEEPDMRAYGSAPVPYSYGSTAQGPAVSQSPAAAQPATPIAYMPVPPSGPFAPQPVAAPYAQLPAPYPYAMPPSVAMAGPKEAALGPANEPQPQQYLPSQSSMPNAQGFPMPMLAPFGQSMPPTWPPALMQGSPVQAPQGPLLSPPLLPPSAPIPPQVAQAPVPMMAEQQQTMPPGPAQPDASRLQANMFGGYPDTERHRTQYAAGLAPKTRPAMAMAPQMYSGMPLPPHPAYQVMPMPLEANSQAGQDPNRPPAEMMYMLPSPVTFNEHTYGAPVDEDLSRAYNAAPRVPLRPYQPQAQGQGRFFAESQPRRAT